MTMKTNTPLKPISAFDRTLRDLKNGAWIEKGRRIVVVYPDAPPRRRRPIVKGVFDRLKDKKFIKYVKRPANVSPTEADFQEGVYVFAEPGELEQEFEDRIAGLVKKLKTEDLQYVSVSAGYEFPRSKERVEPAMVRELKNRDLVTGEGRVLKLKTAKVQADETRRAAKKEMVKIENELTRLKRWADMLKPFGATSGSNHTREVFDALREIGKEAMSLSSLEDPGPVKTGERQRDE